MKSADFSLSNEVLVDLTRAVLLKGLPFRFQVKGFSMVPFIRDGDVVTISPLKVAPVKIGKPVAFINPSCGKFIIHRVIARNNGCYLIQGDNVFSPDGIIPKENILGVVTKVERGSKNISFGFGPERLLIAFFNRYFCLIPALLTVHRFFKKRKPVNE